MNPSALQRDSGERSYLPMLVEERFTLLPLMHRTWHNQHY